MNELIKEIPAKWRLNVLFLAVDES